MQQQPELERRVSELRYQVLLRALLQAGYAQSEAQEMAEQAFQVFLAARQNVELFADVLPTLEQLRRRYMLAALSNGNADVRRVGLGGYFSFALNADMLGVAKPQPQIFLTALARAQVKPGHSVHIGDHPQDDIFGAQQVGMRTVWFNPEQKYGPVSASQMRKSVRFLSCRMCLNVLISELFVCVKYRSDSSEFNPYELAMPATAS